MQDYRIIRTNGNLYDLETATREAIKDGWQIHGQPFRSESSREWCQAATRANGDRELRLREQGRGKTRQGE